MQALFDILSQHVSAELAVFLVSMIPLIELRGSVILGTAIGMPWLRVLLISLIGNLIPIPFILVFGGKLFAWLRRQPLLRGFTKWYEEHLMSKSDTIRKYSFWGLLLFVGIPLPGTGAWSGSFIAVLLGVPPKRAFPGILCGILLAGIIMTVGSQGVASLIHLL
ncbi:MAG: small multi-drug export protein [Eubacteriales bacterium]|nr:small multi-drug export protein [Eubacteriales bacterium]